MAKILIVGGHRAGDPGAGAHGESEVSLFNLMIPYVKEYSKQVKNSTIELYDTSKNLFYETQKGLGAYSLRNRYDYVLEVHWDAGVINQNTGGHLIAGSTPDARDKRVVNVITKYFGQSRSNGVSVRRDLLNLNVFFNSSTSYALLETGFVTNINDINKFKNNVKAYTKELIEALACEKIDVKVEPKKEQKPVTKTATKTATKPATKPTQTEGGKIKMKTYTLSTDVYLRTAAKTNASSIALLKKGSQVKFDDIIVSGGYVWAVQPRSGGTKGYVAIGAINPYGTVK